jgi:hypothetical protein
MVVTSQGPSGSSLTNYTGRTQIAYDTSLRTVNDQSVYTTSPQRNSPQIETHPKQIFKSAWVSYMGRQGNGRLTLKLMG